MNHKIIELQTLREQLAYVHNQSRITNARNMVVLYPYQEMKVELKTFLMNRKVPILSAMQLQQKMPGIYVAESIDFETTDLCIVLGSDNFSVQEIEQIKKYCKGPIDFLKLKFEQQEETIDKNYDRFPIHIKDADIKKAFMMVFDVAEEEIDIVSPWMNRYAVNDVLIEKMEKALNRGVKIRICYGIESDHDSFNQARSERSDEVADFLRERFLDAGLNFRIRRDNIHYKAVICDEKFYLEGSYNYLSFDGDYDMECQRKEGTPFGRDTLYLRTLRQEYFR